jgi:hypothetical protein
MSQLAWQKSSFSGDDANRDCVELAVTTADGAIFLRESDVPDAVVTTTRVALGALIHAVRAGELDRLAR